jgi:hypothetical protein
MTPGLMWTIKDTLVSYIEALDDGTVEAIAPASRSDAGFHFPVEATDGGTLDTRVLQFRGTVRLTGHWGALNVELSDPRVELSEQGATLLVRERGSADPERRIPFADLSISRQETAPDGSTELEAEAALTGHGRLILGAQYRVGEPLSGVRITVPARHA